MSTLPVCMSSQHVPRVCQESHQTPPTGVRTVAAEHLVLLTSEPPFCSFLGVYSFLCAWLSEKCTSGLIFPSAILNSLRFWILKFALEGCVRGHIKWLTGRYSLVKRQILCLPGML